MPNPHADLYARDEQRQQALIRAKLIDVGLCKPSASDSPTVGDLRGRSLLAEIDAELIRGGVDVTERSSASRVNLALSDQWQKHLAARGFSAAHSFRATITNLISTAVTEAAANAPVLYPKWTRTVSVETFKPHERMVITGRSAPPAVAENDELEIAEIEASQEKHQLETWADMTVISRRLLVNDDLGEILSSPISAARAATREVDYQTIAMLCSASGAGPTLADGTAVFHSSRGNLASPGTALSATSLNAAIAAMRMQRDTVSGRAIGIVPRWLLVPPALEATAKILAASRTWEGDDEPLGVLVSPHLQDLVGSTDWYLAADPELFPAAEIGALDDQIIAAETIQMPDRDGIGLRVRVDASLRVVDFRPLYRNPGA